MYRDMSEARNSTTSAMSSGSPSRCMGTAMGSQSLPKTFSMAVLMLPGAMALQVTPKAAPCLATDLVSVSMAPLVVA